MRKRRASSLCYAQLPRAGLGNMLLVWARAKVFAHLNDMELIVAPWARLKIGPILRRERHNRFYFGYFKKNGNYGFLRRQIILNTYRRIEEPEIEIISRREDGAEKKLYVFSQIPHWADYFKGIKEHRELVLGHLYSMLEEKHIEELEQLDPPVIGLHVRMGDYRKLRPGEAFGKEGHIRAPFSYFKTVIAQLRALAGAALPVTIFSDGHDDELEEFLSLPDAARSRATSDITDLLLLSKSRVIVPSPGSTFGYWSAFLSEAAVLHHPYHFHSTIRSEEINSRSFEGTIGHPVEGCPDLLRKNISEIMVPA